MNKIKVSIITVSYNSENTIESCIKSVLSQTYNNIEYIIIDGNSNDNSINIINKYKKSISKILIEDDRGVYDAMNKGISISSGEIVCFLNSDDFFANSESISSLTEFIQLNNLDGCFGNICYVDNKYPDKIKRKWISSEYVSGSFSYGWAPPHPTFYIKRKIYELYGCFNLKFSIAADFELMLRFIEINKINIKFFPHNLVFMRLGGISNKSIINILKQNYEIGKAIRESNLKFNFINFINYKLKNRYIQFWGIE